MKQTDTFIRKTVASAVRQRLVGLSAVRQRLEALPTMLAMVAVLAVGCADDLFPEQGRSEAADGELLFAVGVVEQADLLYQMGQTRAAAGATAADSAIERANAFVAHPFEGSAHGLQVHRMPLPLVGIHPRTASSTLNSSSTRAPLSEIASDGISFHDSLTIWGYTDKERTLFDQVLLKKIRGWRSSVHWPYDQEQRDDWTDEQYAAYKAPTAMKFYAVSPAMESLEDLSLTNKPGYYADVKDEPKSWHAPTFSFTVPDNVGEQRDLLYGESTPGPLSDEWGAVLIQPGPAGSSTADPRGENLGQDNKIVNLRFRHILTAVRFSQGKMPVGTTIKSISLQHIKNKGTYDVATNKWGSYTAASGTWDYDGTTGTQNYTLTPNRAVTAYAPENVYVDGGNVMFLMPHKLHSTEKLEVVLTTKDGNDHTISCDLTDDEWLPGFTMTYKITVGTLKDQYYLVVEPSSNYDTTGGKLVPVSGQNTTETKYGVGSKAYEGTTAQTGSFIIHSYRNAKDYSASEAGINSHVAEPWQVVGFADTDDAHYATADYTYNNDNAKKWVSSFTGWNSSVAEQVKQDGGDNQTISYTMQAITADYTGNHSSILKGNNSVTAVFNLSTHLPNGGGTNGDKMTGYTGEPGTFSIYNSANSYIVNAQGTYKFPLVYGNSYQSGSARNLSSNTLFKDHAGQPIRYANILEQVNSYLTSSGEVEVELTSEEIAAGITKKTVETVEGYGYSDWNRSGNITAEVLWQDVEGLISEVDFAKHPTSKDNPAIGEKKYEIGFINFTVSSTPKPGNAVIALKGEKTTRKIIRTYKSGVKDTEITPTEDATDAANADILWTWHIWVTDEVYPNSDGSNKGYPQYNSLTDSKIVTLYGSDGTATGTKLLPVNLGWVPSVDEFKRYEPHEIWVKLKQVNSSEVVYLKLRREAKQDPVTGTSTVYQWGRPTALRSAFSSLAVSGNYEAEAITNPMRLLDAGGGSWWAGEQRDYWSAAEKTLYDPCPPGFRLPGKAVLDKYLVNVESPVDGTPYGGAELLNMWEGMSSSGCGGYFYGKQHTGAVPPADRYGQIHYLPAGYLWFADPASASQSASLYYSPQNTLSGSVVRFGTSPNADALPVRPLE